MSATAVFHQQRQMPPQEFRDEHIPFGYLITFRSYGTWLHGKSGSVDRFHNAYGTSTLTADAARLRYNRRALSQSPVKLSAQQRALVEEAIRETSEIRKWSLWTVNVRTNHIHAVITAHCKPERVLNAFKANSTRQMREAGCWKSERSPWAEGGSKRYLWTEEQLVNAIVYVQDDQGEPLD
jgi:REP element-mobilizing transposase RayT